MTCCKSTNINMTCSDNEQKKLINPKWNFKCLEKPFSQVRDGEIDEVTKSLDESFDLKTQDNENQLSLLHYAIRFQHHDLALRLVKSMKDVNIVGKHDKTPFHFICEFSQSSYTTEKKEDKVYQLLDEISIKDRQFMTREDVNGCTGVEIASRHGNIQVMNILLKEFDPPFSKDYVVKYLCSAGQCGNQEIVDLIIDKNNKDGQNLEEEDLGKFVQRAVEYGNSHLLDWYTNNKFPMDISIQDDDKTKNTLLHLAVYSGSIDTVNWVLKLENGKSFTGNNNGDYPIHLAARFNLSEILNVILDKFSNAQNVNKKNGKGETTLFIACKNNYMKIFNQLIDIQDIGLDIQNEIGLTPLMVAAKNNSFEIVKKLIDKGANLTIVNNNFQNVLHIVARNDTDTMFREILGNKSGCKLLYVKEGKKGETPLHIVVREGKPELLEHVTGHHLQPNVIAIKNFKGDTPCHIAAKRQRLTFLKSISQLFPFTLNIQNNQGHTPLQVAAEYGKLECVELLLNCKFSGDDKNINQKILCIASENGHHKLVKHLLENHKYDVDDVKKAFRKAFDNNHKAVIETLLDSKFGLQTLEKDEDEKDMTEAAMVRLIKSFPDIAETVLDRCVKKQKDKIKPDFKYIDITDDVSTKSCISLSYNSVDNHPCMIMALERHENLLKHPVTLLWIKNEWKTYGRLMFLIEFIPYILYIISLSLYALKVQDKHSFVRAMNDTEWNNYTKEEKTAIIDQENLNSYTYTCFVTICTLLCVCYEVFQFIHMCCLYFRQWSNLFDLVLYITTFVMIWVGDIPVPMKYCHSFECWKLPVSAILLLCAWLNFLRYLKFFSFFGIFLLMFVRTLKTVVKLGLMLGIFILAFSFSLHITLMDQRPFKGFGWGYLKTVSMSLGEFTYDEIFRNEEAKVKFHTTTIVTFLALIGIMTIVLMNMLIGIAVNNISKVQADAEVERVVSQIKVVLRFKRIKICPNCFGRVHKSFASVSKSVINCSTLSDWLNFNSTYFMTTKNIRKAWDARQKYKRRKSAESLELEGLMEYFQKKEAYLKK